MGLEGVACVHTMVHHGLLGCDTEARPFCILLAGLRTIPAAFWGLLAAS